MSQPASAQPTYSKLHQHTTDDSPRVPALAACPPVTASLAAIAGQWELLAVEEHVLRAAVTGVAPTGESALPGGTDRLSLAHEITTTLTAWVGYVRYEHLSETPGSPPRGLRDTDVPGLCAWLRPHADWIETRYAAYPPPTSPNATAAQELARLAGALTALVDPTGIRRPPIGPCPLTITTPPYRPDPALMDNAEGDQRSLRRAQAAAPAARADTDPTTTQCPGTIRGYIDTDHPEAADLTCDTDPTHRWHRGTWMQLSRALGHTTPERLDTPALATYLTNHFRVPVTDALVRKWTKRYGLGIHRGGDGLWDRVGVTSWMRMHLSTRHRG